jgi:hypothetical protein
MSRESKRIIYELVMLRQESVAANTKALFWKDRKICYSEIQSEDHRMQVR